MSNSEVECPQPFFSSVMPMVSQASEMTSWSTVNFQHMTAISVLETTPFKIFLDPHPIISHSVYHVFPKNIISLF